MTPKKKLVTYDGNYDQFIKTKTEKEENQMKQYKWEQEQIKSMKEYIARFGHGTAKNAKQAQSKEKVLQKMIRAGLTEKPEEEKPLNFKFTDPGHLPPPVLAFHDVEFGYPGCEPLYKNVNFGVDLDSRVALVGPNGAGKTTLVKLYVWWESFFVPRVRSLLTISLVSYHLQDGGRAGADIGRHSTPRALEAGAIYAALCGRSGHGADAVGILFSALSKRSVRRAAQVLGSLWC